MRDEWEYERRQEIEWSERLSTPANEAKGGSPIAMTENLYNLTTALAELESKMEPDETTGEIVITDEDLERYFNLQNATTEKAANTVKFIKNLEAQVPGLDTEINRLTARKRVINNFIDRIKKYALKCMQESGMKSIGEKPYSLNRQRNSQPSVIVPDGTDLKTWEDRFKVVKVEPDKRAILEAWKVDEPIPANVEVHEGEHIRVR